MGRKPGTEVGVNSSFVALIATESVSIAILWPILPPEVDVNRHGQIAYINIHTYSTYNKTTSITKILVVSRYSNSVSPLRRVILFVHQTPPLPALFLCGLPWSKPKPNSCEKITFSAQGSQIWAKARARTTETLAKPEDTRSLRETTTVLAVDSRFANRTEVTKRSVN